MVEQIYRFSCKYFFKQLTLKEKIAIFSLLTFITFFVESLFSLVFFIPIFSILSEKSSKEKHLILFLAFILYNVIGSYWLLKIEVKAGIWAFVLNSIGMYLFSCFCFVISFKLKKYLLIIFVPVWLLFEELNNSWHFSWPFLSIGNILSDNNLFCQFYDITGEIGGSLTILVLNLLIYKVIISITIKEKKQYLFFCISLIIIIILYGYLKVNFREFSINRNIYTKALIPNFKFKHFAKIDNRVIDSLFLKKREFNKNSILILPENAIINNIWVDNIHNSILVNIIENYVKQEKVKGCIFGTVIKTVEKISQDLFYKYDKNFKLFYNEYGASIFLDSNKNTQIHFKRKLVPKEEFLPPWLDGKGIESSKLSHGSDFSNLKLDSSASIINLICYESCFSNDIAKCVTDNSQAIIMIANQQLFQDKFADKFYTNICKLRAIETGRYFLKISNMGLSCLINPNGEIVSKGENYKYDIFHSILPLIKSKTFYSKYSLSIHRFYLMLLPIVLILVLGFHHLQYLNCFKKAK